MQIKNAVLLNIKGDPMKQSSNPPGFPAKDTDPVLLISDVLLNAALSPAAQTPYEPAKATARYKFALTLNDVKEGDDLEVPAELAIELDRDVSRVYNNVMIAGQMHELLK